MIKCCIFDLDGTLLDTLRTITYYVNKTFEDEGVSPITNEECRYFAGSGPRKLIERALFSKGIDDPERVSEILKKYRNNYDSAPLYLTAPFDGITEMLDTLIKNGILVGVVSNKQHESVVPAIESFFGSRFSMVLGSREGVPLKPAPDAFYIMMKELGVKADEVCYVGDIDIDMQTGKAFGAKKTVGVTWGFRDRAELIENGADVIISSPDELIAEVLSR